MTDIGQTAPDFTLPRDGGGQVTLSALRPKAVVLYFYPRDDTSGCTREAIAFNEKTGDFAAAGAEILGVSKDSVASHDKFVKKHGLGVLLASDENADVCERYGVWVEKSMYGKKYMGIER
ncbi:MAG: peroxiredoxin, partial [Paracoccaceae bacterium]|nr:peroxiredoxin [Paracoccaceae bacterium]